MKPETVKKYVLVDRNSKAVVCHAAKPIDLEWVETESEETHPHHVKVGDLIDDNVAGFSKTEVKFVTFAPNAAHFEGVYMSGTYTFTCGDGFRSFAVSGLSHAPIYVFKK